MSAVLRLSRQSVVMEIVRDRFEVALDGALIGTVGMGETFETPIPDGHHTIRLRSGRYSSRQHSFDVLDDGGRQLPVPQRPGLAPLRAAPGQAGLGDLAPAPVTVAAPGSPRLPGGPGSVAPAGDGGTAGSAPTCRTTPPS